MALILIIDDAALSRAMVRKTLNAEGYKTIEANNGKQGVEMADIHRPDCICLDVLLPELNGFEVLQKLKEEGLDIPVIMITADTQETTREKCLNLGAFAVMNKPAKAEILSQTITQAIAQKKQGE